MNEQPTAADQNPPTNWQFKPGETTTPTCSPANSPAPAPQSGAALAPAPPAAASSGQEANPPQAEAEAETGPAQPSSADSISWTASEFVAHDKTASWHGLVVLAAIVLAALVFLLTKDKISTGAIVVVGVVLSFYGARQPRQLQYSLDDYGLTIASKHYDWAHFRSFAVIDEGAFSNILFIPLKRFSPLIAVYFDPKDEARIVDLLSQRLPVEDRQHDLVERFMRHIHF